MAVLVAAVVVAMSAVVGGVTPAEAEVNPYVTEGTHTVNGRQWRTTCEPYSQTRRCRTGIWSTQVRQINGKFVSRNQWAFNNLTYLASPRTLWKGNRLAFATRWTSKDGRRWYTECDTPATGRNGCCSYIQSRVIEATRKNGVWTYRWVTKYVFNNIVNFSVPQPPAGPVVTMPDGNLRECVNLEMDKDADADITFREAAKFSGLSCQGRAINDLRGLEAFTNIRYLYLGDNEISDVGPLQGLKHLGLLNMEWNSISDVTPLASMTGLDRLDLGHNKIVDASPLQTLTAMRELSLHNNRVKDLKPLSAMRNMTRLEVTENQIDDLGPVAGLGGLTDLLLGHNNISDVSALATLPKLDVLQLRGNSITNVTPLQGLTTLSALTLSENLIVDVAPIAKLRGLTLLWLDSNRIIHVSPLATLPELRILYLWKNPIVDRNSLDPLESRGCRILFEPQG